MGTLNLCFKVCHIPYGRGQLSKLQIYHNIRLLPVKYVLQFSKRMTRYNRDNDAE